MSDYIFYYEGIEGTTITLLNMTADTDYPTSNMQDRNIHTYFTDSSFSQNTVAIGVDFGSGVTRDADHIVLKHKITGVAATGTVQYSDNGSDWTSTDYSGEALTENTTITELWSFTAESAHRYWRMVWQDLGDPLTALQVFNVILGDKYTWNHNPELALKTSRGYEVENSEGAGGYRYSRIRNTNPRRKWELDYKYIDSTEQAKLEAWADVIGCNVNNGKPSRYPFYFSNDGGTTLYYVRALGPLVFDQMAYDAFQTKIILEEEL